MTLLQDMSTIIWKEWKEILLQRGNFRGGAFGLLLFLGVFGIMLPLQFGAELVNNPLVLVFWAWVPLLLVMGVVIDSFAGERERHTLETLLASRLSDRAILFGKILSSVLYGWLFTILCLTVGLITINVAYGSKGLLMFSPESGVTVLLLTLMMCILIACLGVIASLRAPTVKQAAQSLTIFVMGVGLVPFIGFVIMPDGWKAELLNTVMSVGIINIIIVVVAAVAALDIVLMLVAMARFQRAKLILD